jgi:formylmethanofuran dehydrogenase subunit E
MVDKRLLEVGFEFHGHRCPAMPLGLRCGLAAMRELGVERSKDKELYVISETGNDHAAGCFLDGIMTATGCTYGKSNIEKKYYNKMAFTLIDRETNRGIRVRLKDEFFANILKSPFVNLRKEGVLPQDIKSEVADPLIENVLNMPEEKFLEIGEIQEIILPKKKGCFETILCEECGERVFSNKTKKFNGKEVCLGCYEKLTKE